ncbi:Nijmegen breakage syndrome 1 protein [Gracilariopsis chorda]|uniref:Nijmegen breakage syndrome 1 protein n=1 Tax=Gracilariopsis chorda TaxID=448386 RepID=A0A2V3IZ00_9FLOR|nr:Nijmegen breakage syndrome 1 protein [Gracilariopsis chorda]|eukprot:PXF47295.1 Nijmegen breakage syndrome 1 protein [Gracilariopsis chorda]
MWYIQEESRKHGPKYWLGGTQSHGRTIGRKVVDIRLRASSVSRVHAKICVHTASFYAPPGKHKQTSGVSVTDFSAYGTFLKYPQNHIASRDEPAGHHRRLNKDDPTDVYEGALLAFGAPSAWWQVCWWPILVLPSRLSPAERARLDEVSAWTSLQETEQMTDSVTHLITSTCVSTSQKFLTMLARNGHVVQLAWLEALQMVVVNACKSILSAETEDVAIAATHLPIEENYLPPFSQQDLSNYVPDVLQNVLKPTQRERRKNMFRDIVFAFVREERRAWWASIIDHLGGVTVLSRAIPERPELRGSRVLYLKDIAEGRHFERVSGFTYMEEKDVIESILRADLIPIEYALDLVRLENPKQCNPRTAQGSNQQRSGQTSGGADTTDVATPGPLDAESDDESYASGAADAYRRCGQSKATVMSAGEERAVEARSVGSRDKSRQNPSVQESEQGTQRLTKDRELHRKRLRSASDQGEHVGKTGPHATNQCDDPSNEITPHDVSLFDEISHSKREFFSVPAAPNSEHKAGASVGDEGDVRPFRKRKLPSATSVPLRRVKVVRERRVYNTGAKRRLVSQDQPQRLSETRKCVSNSDSEG